MIGLRQPVSRIIPPGGRERREQNRELVGRDDERGPARERPAADVHRIFDHRGPVLQQEAGRHPGQAAGQNQRRQLRPLLVNDVVELFDRHRGVGFDLRVALSGERAAEPHRRTACAESNSAIRP